MQISELLSEIEAFAPIFYQENYDNCGVQVGNVQNEATGALLAIDVTEETVAEAMEHGCNLIIAHHPLIFSGLKKITGAGYVERVLMKAIKNDMVIYAAHTNLDNVRQGVNHKMTQKLGLVHTRILAPAKGNLCKLYTYVPREYAGQVQDALFAAGAGHVGNYSECSYTSPGQGTFRPGADTNPAIGSAGGERESVAEVKIEVLMPLALQQKVVNTLKAAHPYEEVAYEIIRLENENQTIGAGMVGELPQALPVPEFLAHLKKQMKTACIKYTHPRGDLVKTVAVCGGSGSFLLKNAMVGNADVFVTADCKYHQFFDAEGKIMIADIGHYESEQFTVEIFAEILKEKFPNFALLFTKKNTNPVNYYY
ncbi:MAG: Nif3-like dinuclear metal center hexameric protein [Edaphocola sp.]